MRLSTNLRGLFSSVVVICLFGCIPNMSAVMYRDSDISTPDRGHLVGSIGTSTLPGWRQYDIEFRSKDKKVRGFVAFRSEPTSPLDWDEVDWKGRAFSVALPPGEYEFYIMRLGNKSLERIVNTEISLPFEVKRDEVVYVGELKWTQTQHEVGSLVKGYRPDHASFSISDRAARDVLVIQGRYPEIVGHPLRIEIPTGDRGKD
jgi:hypothetical protein